MVQEVFVAAWKAIDRFRGDSAIETWLVRLTINQCRKQRRRKMLGLKLLRQWTQRTATHIRELDSLSQDERRSRVREAVRQLPSRYREVMVLRYLEGMDVIDIARVLNLSRSAVEVRLHRAREMLKGPLGDLMES